MAKMNIKRNIVNTGVHPVENFLQEQPTEKQEPAQVKAPIPRKEGKVRINLVVNQEFSDILSELAAKEMCSKTAIIVRSVLKYKEAADGK